MRARRAVRIFVGFRKEGRVVARDLQRCAIGIGEVLAEIGVDAQAVLDAPFADDRKALLREATAEAQSRGIFGAPTFFTRGEMFWGNDRLDDALAFAVAP